MERATYRLDWQQREVAREIFSEILAGHVMLPSQLAQRRVTSPEVALWAAVLDDALTVVVRPEACQDKWLRSIPYERRPERVRQAAKEWLRSDGRMVGEFAWVCEVLGLDVGAVRQALIRRGVALDDDVVPARGRDGARQNGVCVSV